MTTDYFSGRAQDYSKFRVDYPSFLQPFLLNNLKVSRDTVVADIGSGTGLLARWFLELGAQVYGVEPNEDMRKEGEVYLAEFRNFKSIAATAEDTTLPNHSVDFLVGGNAFHWFKHDLAKKEFSRILKPNGLACFIRTDWKEHSGEQMKAYDEIVMRYCIGRGGIVTDPVVERKVFHEFFSQYKSETLGESEVLYTMDQLKGRFLSTSFSPKKEDPRHEDAMRDIENLFENYQQNGKFAFGTLLLAVYGSL